MNRLINASTYPYPDTILPGIMEFNQLYTASELKNKLNSINNIPITNLQLYEMMKRISRNTNLYHVFIVTRPNDSARKEQIYYTKIR